MQQNINIAMQKTGQKRSIYCLAYVNKSFSSYASVEMLVLFGNVKSYKLDNGKHLV